MEKIDGFRVADDMNVYASHCSRFSRRYDVNAFNMMDYRSCENCTHLDADNHCIAGGQPGGYIQM